jgi:hypothetical protein
MKASVATSEDVRFSEGFTSRASNKAPEAQNFGVSSDPHVLDVKKQDNDPFVKAVSQLNNSQTDLAHDTVSVASKSHSEMQPCKKVGSSASSVNKKVIAKKVA